MAKLFFRYSAMNAGKSTNLLQANFNYNERGMQTMLWTAALDDRGGDKAIESRIGLFADAHRFGHATDLWERINAATRVEPLACVLVDEAQFLTRALVWQLSEVVDQLRIPVLCYGLRTDFRGQPFAGSAYLLALAGAGLGWAHRASLDALYALVDSALAHPGFAGGDAAALAGARLQGALALVDDPHVAERLAHTPRIHLLATEPGDLARQAALIEGDGQRYAARGPGVGRPPPRQEQMADDPDSIPF